MQGKPRVVSVKGADPIEREFPSEREWEFLEIRALESGRKKQGGFLQSIKKFFGM